MIENRSEVWYAIFVDLFDMIAGGKTMAKPKKNGTYLNVCIETPIYERLKAMCDDAGQSKTVAVERALSQYLDEYDVKQKMLKELEFVHLGKGKQS